MSKVLIDRELLCTALKADASIGATAHELVAGWSAMEKLREAVLAAPSGTPAMPVKAYYHEAPNEYGGLNKSVGLEVRKEFADAPLVLEADALAQIACLEGEIAKRDARIVALEADLYRANARVSTLNNQWSELDAELSALKAQEPIGWYTEDHLDDKSATTYSWTVAERWVEKGWPVSPLYAAPVSEAKARVYEPLVCDYCNAETQDPWHGSGMLNGVESRHIHACSQCRNLLPTTKAQCVVMQASNFEASNGEYRNPGYKGQFDGETVEQAEARRHWATTATELATARLNAAPVQQVSVPDWMASSRAFADRLYMAGWRDHADAQHSGVAGMYDELLAAAPAAPAEDAWIPVSERLPNIAQEVIVHSEFDGVCAGVLDSYGEWFAPCSEYKLIRVTSWMPMPTKIEANRHE